MRSMQLLSVAVLCVFFSTSFAGESSYENFSKARAAKQKKFKEDYKSRYDKFRAEVAKKWGSGTELSNDTIYVAYSEDLDTKTVIDFQNNQIRVESLKDSTEATPAHLQNAALEVLNRPIDQIAAKDPLLKGAKPKDSRPLSETFAPNTPLEKVFSDGEITVEPSTIETNAPADTQPGVADATSKNITRVTVSIDGKKLFQIRAEPYLPKVYEQASKYSLNAAVLLAIMQVESSFNPLAQSPIPAYGLMQIVPESAGEDVNARVLGKGSTPPSEDLLLTPNDNISYGAAYIHLLNTLDLGNIKNPESRLYCVIAAYNTGPGNLATVFHPQKKKSLGKAIEVINSLSPDQVYQTLVQNLPYVETRVYLKKVTDAVPEYQSI